MIKYLLQLLEHRQVYHQHPVIQQRKEKTRILQLKEIAQRYFGNEKKSRSTSDIISQDIITLEVRNNGRLYPWSQIEDYVCRGVNLEQYSFLSFVVDMYEEAIPQKARVSDETDRQTSESFEQAHRGCIPNECSSYLSDHPKHLTHRQVVRCAGHNTHPNIVGPFFPNPNDESKRSLYCTSMLALLHSWHNLQDIKDGSETFEEAYDIFHSSAVQDIQDVLSGIQYHYDCKIAADTHREEQDDMNLESEEQERERETQEEEIASRSEMMEVEGENTLSEEDLQFFRDSMKNLWEERHGREAISIAQAKGILIGEGNKWENGTENISIAHGDDL